MKHHFFFGAACASTALAYVVVVYTSVYSRATFEDTLTGCKYVYVGKGFISPKIGANSKQECTTKRK